MKFHYENSDGRLITMATVYHGATFKFRFNESSMMQRNLCTIWHQSSKHPEFWTKEEVGAWLRWCTEEYSIDPVPLDKFDLNGKALCLLSRNDFIERVPKNGDVLYNSLKLLILKQVTGGRMLYQSGLSSGTDWYPKLQNPHKAAATSVSSSARYLLMSPSSPSNMPYVPRCSAYVPIQPHPCSFIKHEDNEFPQMIGPTSSHVGSGTFIRPSSAPDDLRTERMNLDILRQDRSSDCRLLWEFIYQLLCDTKYTSHVCWEDQEAYVFRIINPTGLAELWGQQKNRTNMTYEKLSRALRYYYRMNIIKKVPGKRLTYRFLQPPMTIQKGQRGAKPHYKSHLDDTSDRNVPRADRDSPVSSCYQYSSCKLSPKDDSSIEANLEDTDDDEGENEVKTDICEQERVHTPQSPNFEVWEESSMGKLNVSQENIRTSSDIELNMSSRQAHASNILSYPRSTLLDCGASNKDYELQTGISPGFQQLKHHDPFLLMPSTSQVHSHSFPYLKIGHKSSTLTCDTDFGDDRKEQTEEEDSAQSELRRTVRLQEPLFRSRSLDFAQSYHTAPCPFRPTTILPASPKPDEQFEPEDLSVKGRSDVQK